LADSEISSTLIQCEGLDMTTPLEQGIQAARAGNKQEALRYLATAAQQEPQNISVWLWLSYVVDDPAKKKDCLERVLNIDPYNQSARVGLAELEKPAPTVAPYNAPNQARVSIKPNPDAQPKQDLGAQGGGEVVLYRDDNIMISNYRILTSKGAFAIGEAKTAFIVKTSPTGSYILAGLILIGLIGVSCVLFGNIIMQMSYSWPSSSNLFDALRSSAPYSMYALLCLSAFGIFVASGIIISIVIAVRAKPKYSVVLTRWTDTITITDSFYPKDKAYIEKIVEIINQAIRIHNALPHRPSPSGQVLVQYGSAGKPAWSGGEMAALVIGSILIPIFGVGFGIYGLAKAGKRGQGAALLIVGVVAWVINIIILLSL
jgi:hypothetical protein